MINFKPWQVVVFVKSFQELPAGIKGVISGYEFDNQETLIGFFVDIYEIKDFMGCTVGPISPHYLRVNDENK